MGPDSSFKPLRWTFAAHRCRDLAGSSLSISFSVRYKEAMKMTPFLTVQGQTQRNLLLQVADATLCWMRDTHFVQTKQVLHMHWPTRAQGSCISYRPVNIQYIDHLSPLMYGFIMQQIIFSSQFYSSHSV